MHTLKIISQTKKWKSNRGGKFDQNTFYACIEILQWNSFFQLIFANKNNF
jgi:hypothetical protein